MVSLPLGSDFRVKCTLASIAPYAGWVATLTRRRCRQRRRAFSFRPDLIAHPAVELFLTTLVEHEAELAECWLVLIDARHQVAVGDVARIASASL